VNDHASANRTLLTGVARELGSLRKEVVFVGGQVTELLITSPAATRIRPTTDVDIVVEASTHWDYGQVEAELRAMGFKHDATKGSPICRWTTPGGFILDVMPAEGQFLGFTNKWYAQALRSARWVSIAVDLEIRIPTAPVFLGTKWEAFLNRGAGDLLGSHDLEDIISLIAGRAEIILEVASASSGLRAYLADAARAFLENDMAAYAVQGALPDAIRVPELVPQTIDRIRALARLEED
jgi:predicted nucleotidyltransferase